MRLLYIIYIKWGGVRFNINERGAKKRGGYVGEWRKGQDHTNCEKGDHFHLSLSLLYIYFPGRGPLYTSHNLRTANTTNLQL